MNLFTTLIIALTFTTHDPAELGQVNWLRDYDIAVEQSENKNKPILILFQEVPGCSTCRNYGLDVLSHPLLVEAIEQYFVPLAVHNNRGGEDARILKKYGEPSWNNPVVRIIDRNESELVPRLSSDYSKRGLYQTMALALKKIGETPDPYFELLGQELNAISTETAYYRMFCFWSGESHLGQAEGVISTEPGFMGGAEVVKVMYDPEVISKAWLDTYASEGSCSKVDRESQFRVDKDPQYHLKNSDFRYLPLSPTQRSKINSAIANGTSGSKYLSPRQLKWLNEVNHGDELKELYHLPIRDSWNLMADS